MNIENRDSLKTVSDTKTTSFADDGTMVSSDYGTVMATDGLPIFQQGLTDFLAKPYLLYSAEWNTSSTTGSVLYTLPIHRTIKSGTTIINPFQVPIWYEKIKGHNLFRGTFVLKLVINATPFQAGALMGHLLPLATAKDEAGDLTYAVSHNVNLTTRSQQPKFIITTSESGAEIEIPYISPTNWFIPADGPTGNSSYNFDWGTFYLVVLSQLATGSGQTTIVPYSVYGYWKDVELGAPMVPQMLGSVPSRKKSKKSIVIRSQKSLLSKESEKVESGKPVTNVLNVASSVASTLSSIPVLEAAMKPTSWALSALAGVSSYFGWSKPLDNSIPHITSLQYNRYLATSDGSDTAYPLALRSDNLISCRDDLTPYEGDEMSFSFLKKQHAYINSVTWDSSTIDGTNIYSNTISPSTIKSTGSVVKGTQSFNYSTGPPLYYLSKGFSLWRGSLVLRIKVVKTQLHTGRLQVTWTPAYNAGVTVDRFNSAYSIREIIDLRDGDEFELVLPYMMDTHYLSLGKTSGKLDIIVLNELRAPTTVASTVDMLFFWSGGDDLELASPLTGSTPSVNMQAFSPQVFLGDGGGVVSSCTVGDVPCPESSIIHADFCMGELFTSLKQVLNRATLLSIDATTITNSNLGLTFDPHISSMLYGTTTGLAGPLIGADFYSYVSPMYAMFRGGVTISVATNKNGSGNQMNLASLYKLSPSGLTVSGPGAFPANGNYSPAQATSGSTFGGQYATGQESALLSFSIPYYSQTHSSLTHAQSSVNAISASLSHPKAGITMFLFGSQYTRFYRNTRDDFQFSYFIGCPPVLDSITTV